MNSQIGLEASSDRGVNMEIKDSTEAFLTEPIGWEYVGLGPLLISLSLSYILHLLVPAG